MNLNAKYPDITVKLSDEDGNVYSILGSVRKALRRADVPTEDIDKFTTEATSGDYDHALQTVMRWVNVE